MADDAPQLRDRFSTKN